MLVRTGASPTASNTENFAMLFQTCILAQFALSIGPEIFLVLFVVMAMGLTVSLGVSVVVAVPTDQHSEQPVFRRAMWGRGDRGISDRMEGLGISFEFIDQLRHILLNLGAYLLGAGIGAVVGAWLGAKLHLLALLVTALLAAGIVVSVFVIVLVRNKRPASGVCHASVRDRDVHRHGTLE